jgi:hypothetical protein
MTKELLKLVMVFITQQIVDKYGVESKYHFGSAGMRSDIFKKTDISAQWLVLHAYNDEDIIRIKEDITNEIDISKYILSIGGTQTKDDYDDTTTINYFVLNVNTFIEKFKDDVDFAVELF